VGGPRVARSAARRHFPLPCGRPVRLGEEGGVAGGVDGPRRWGEWRHRRLSWLATRPQPTFAAEWEGLGLRRAKRAGMRCVYKVPGGFLKIVTTCNFVHPLRGINLTIKASREIFQAPARKTTRPYPALYCLKHNDRGACARKKMHHHEAHELAVLIMCFL